jgi:hypothetical protein
VQGRSLESVERALEDENAAADRTLALSSLAYGYFMLAERAAASERPDPALVARLERWNDLLGSAYEKAERDPSFRTAVREAALDLHARAPAVGCEDAGSCPSTGLLLETLRRIDDPASETGVRGALGKLLGRMLGDEPEREAPAVRPVAD